MLSAARALTRLASQAPHPHLASLYPLRATMASSTTYTSQSLLDLIVQDHKKVSERLLACWLCVPGACQGLQRRWGRGEVRVAASEGAVAGHPFLVSSTLAQHAPSSEVPSGSGCSSACLRSAYQLGDGPGAGHAPT